MGGLASGRTGRVPGRPGGIAPGRMPGMRDGRIPGTPGGFPTAGGDEGLGRGTAAAAGAPVVIGNGVAGPEESMLISP